jgi:hypothetical protein
MVCVGRMKERVETHASGMGDSLGRLLIRPPERFPEQSKTSVRL